MDKYYTQLMQILEEALVTDGINHEFYEMFCFMHYDCNNHEESTLNLYRTLMRAATTCHQLHYDTRNWLVKAQDVNIPVYRAHLEALVKYLHCQQQHLRKTLIPKHTLAEIDAYNAKRFKPIRPPKIEEKLSTKDNIAYNRIKDWKYAAIHRLNEYMYILQQIEMSNNPA